MNSIFIFRGKSCLRGLSVMVSSSVTLSLMSVSLSANARPLPPNSPSPNPMASCQVYANDLPRFNRCRLGRPVHTNANAVPTFARHNNIQATGQTSFYHALQQAYHHSASIDIERLRIQEQTEDYQQVRAQSRLNATMNASFGPTASHTVYSVVEREEDRTDLRRNVSLEATYPVYQGGRIRAQKRSSLASMKAGQANLTQTENEVLQQTALAYIDILRDQAFVEFTRQNLALLEKQHSNVQILLENKESTETDLALIQTRMTNIKVEHANAKSALENSAQIFETLTGQRPNILLTPPPLFPVPSIREATQIALQNNPQLSALHARIEAADHDIAVAKAGRKPTLSLQTIIRASEGNSQTIERNAEAQMLMNFRMPILSGGQNKSRTRQTRFIKSRIELERAETVRRLNQSISQLWLQFNNARQTQSLNKDKITTAQRAYDGTKIQLEAGISTLFDLISSEQSLLEAKMDYIRSQHSQMTAHIQLLAVLGLLNAQRLGLGN